MTQIQVSIDSSEVRGTGNKLYALIQVDTDDSEDTTIELWRANNEDHFYEQVSEAFYNGEDPEDFIGPNFDKEIWGIILLPKFIGTL
jgi:hypothetical protein